MRFFTRCKILYRSLMLFCVCMGIFLALRLSSISVDSSPKFFFFCFGCCIFLFLIISLIILRCIIKDAEEDLTAIAKLKDKSDTHVGNPDVDI